LLTTNVSSYRPQHFVVSYGKRSNDANLADSFGLVKKNKLTPSSALVFVSIKRTSPATTSMILYKDNILACLLLLAVASSWSPQLYGVAAADASSNSQLRRRRRQQSNGVLTLQLVDASTGQVVVEELQNGMDITLDDDDNNNPQLNIVAVADTDQAVAAVKFSNGRVEGGQPFSYCGGSI